LSSRDRISSCVKDLTPIAWASISNEGLSGEAAMSPRPPGYKYGRSLYNFCVIVSLSAD